MNQEQRVKRKKKKKRCGDTTIIFVLTMNFITIKPGKLAFSIMCLENIEWKNSSAVI
jgi:hypothetical protein